MRSTIYTIVAILFGLLPITAVAQNGDDGSQTWRYAREQRERMVERTIRARGITDSLVLAAMHAVPRHLFVPPDLRHMAYSDRPLPIGMGQTISQPYIVALMTELLRPKPGHRIFEVGTGSGYQAAVLAAIVDTVFSIEIVAKLSELALRNLDAAGVRNIVQRTGDGYRGWPERAPFDGIVVTAAPDHIPQPLIAQLKVGGRMVIPVGDTYQELIVIIKKADGSTERRTILPVRFVPMTGEAQE